VCSWLDGLGELQDLVGDVQQQLLVLLFLLVDCLPVVVGQHLALLVGPVLADHHEGRQESGFERHDHGEQSERVGLDPKPIQEANQMMCSLRSGSPNDRSHHQSPAYAERVGFSAAPVRAWVEALQREVGVRKPR
jgi:hypothetical protein